MLLSLENGIDFLQCFAFCFHPIQILDGISVMFISFFIIFEEILTIKTNVTISHEPLMMYVFHVIFVSAMGMTNVRSKLKQTTLA